MEVVLEPLSPMHIPDLIASGISSHSESYRLPRSLTEAAAVFAALEVHRSYEIGDEFVAFDPELGSRIVGGGQYHREGSPEDPGAVIAYWVELELRERGYGKAIVRAIEERVVQAHPEFTSFTAYIDSRNIGSIALAASMGYETDDDVSQGGVLAYRKRIREP